jgi:hypothetical protein
MRLEQSSPLFTIKRTYLALHQLLSRLGGIPDRVALLCGEHDASGVADFAGGAGAGNGH